MPRPAAAGPLLCLVLWLGSCGSTPNPGAAAEDPRVGQLRDRAMAIRSIDPGDDDFSDLRPLGPILEGAQVVVLGEATHGDGETFRAKARLVRFLHRELGFDVLAFESGFYDCWKAWRAIEPGEDPGAAFRRSVFPIWTRAAQLQPLIAHFAAAARSERPLELAGIDPQFTGALSDGFLLDDLVAVAEALGLPGERWRERVSGPLANLLSARYEQGELPEEAERTAFLDALAELEDRLREEGAGLPERGFWLRLVESTRAHAATSWRIDWNAPLLESPHYGIRDHLMGEQLAWLARERFADRRIVAWMHSGHAARGLAGVEVPSPVHARLYRTLQPAGAVAHAELGDAVYTVAVLAYQGRYRTPRGLVEELLRPTEGSLEDLFHRTGLPHAFLDLRASERRPQWLDGPMIARPVGYKEMRARWPEVFDGILFLDRMEPREWVGASVAEAAEAGTTGVPP